ncbi:hypothetical protein TNCT_394261, partial [Trichonephila clavata]
KGTEYIKIRWIRVFG